MSTKILLRQSCGHARSEASDRSRNWLLSSISQALEFHCETCPRVLNCFDRLIKVETEAAVRLSIKAFFSLQLLRNSIFVLHTDVPLT